MEYPNTEEMSPEEWRERAEETRREVVDEVARALTRNVDPGRAAEEIDEIVHTYLPDDGDLIEPIPHLVVRPDGDEVVFEEMEVSGEVVRLARDANGVWWYADEAAPVDGETPDDLHLEIATEALRVTPFFNADELDRVADSMRSGPERPGAASFALGDAFSSRP